MDKVENKAIKDVVDGLTIASQFDWGSFSRLLILILLLSGIFLLVFFLYTNWKKKILSLQRATDPSIATLVAGIPDILKITEKMAEYQQETIYRIIGYISQERLGYISRRYVKGFISHIKCYPDIDDVNKEFDDMIEDIAREVVEAKVFKDYIKNSTIMIDIIDFIKDSDFSSYQLQKVIEVVINSAISEAIKESKKLSFVEVT